MVDNVNHPQHYRAKFPTKQIECIDITRHMPFCVGNAFKYIWRAGDKGDNAKAIEDCNKALWYINDANSHPGDLRIGESAKAIFRWTTPQDTPQFQALWGIVCGDWAIAKAEINRMIQELENENR